MKSVGCRVVIVLFAFIIGVVFSSTFYTEKKIEGKFEVKPIVLTTIPDVTMCELFSTPEKYNHQVIHIKAALVTGIDTQSLVSPKCNDGNKFWLRPHCENDETCKVFSTIYKITTPKGSIPPLIVIVDLIGRFEKDYFSEEYSQNEPTLLLLGLRNVELFNGSITAN